VHQFNRAPPSNAEDPFTHGAVGDWHIQSSQLLDNHRYPQ
jgi:hypothetical protein